MLSGSMFVLLQESPYCFYDDLPAAAQSLLKRCLLIIFGAEDRNQGILGVLNNPLLAKAPKVIYLILFGNAFFHCNIEM